MTFVRNFAFFRVIFYEKPHRIQAKSKRKKLQCEQHISLEHLCVHSAQLTLKLCAKSKQAACCAQYADFSHFHVLYYIHKNSIENKHFSSILNLSRNRYDEMVRFEYGQWRPVQHDCCTRRFFVPLTIASDGRTKACCQDRRRLIL